jgi:HEAT repeat protein
MQASEVEIVRQLAKDVQLPSMATSDDSPLQDLVEAFPSSPAVARRDMRRMMERNPAQFFHAACRILKACSEGPGQSCLVELLWRNPVLMISLADPAAFPLPAAIALAKRWAKLDPMLDVKLLHLGFPPDCHVVSGLDAARERRVLAIVDELPAVRHILLPLARLLRSQDPQVRSKAAALYCRVSQNPEWVRKVLSEPDARIRGNAVEGLWGANSDAVRNLLLEASRDRNHRVAANALIGLHHIDSPQAAAGLKNMACCPEPEVRSAAAFAMGQTTDPGFREDLQVLLKDPDSRVSSLAFRSLIRIQQHGAKAAAFAGEEAGQPAPGALAGDTELPGPAAPAANPQEPPPPAGPHSPLEGQPPNSGTP